MDNDIKHWIGEPFISLFTILLNYTDCCISYIHVICIFEIDELTPNANAAKGLSLTFEVIASPYIPLPILYNIISNHIAFQYARNMLMFSMFQCYILAVFDIKMVTIDFLSSSELLIGHFQFNWSEFIHETDMRRYPNPRTNPLMIEICSKIIWWLKIISKLTSKPNSNFKIIGSP